MQATNPGRGWIDHADSLEVVAPFALPAEQITDSIEATSQLALVSQS